MKRGTDGGTGRLTIASSGYTIIETMIFLVITGALLASALYFLTGQQTRTQFNQGLREMDAQIRGTLNEVESGYFDDRGGFTCTAGPGATLTIASGGSAAQGTNQDCVFMGKVIQFGPSNGGGCSGDNENECKDYAVHTVVGKRTVTGGVSPATLNDAVLTPIFTSSRSANSPDISEYRSLPGGLRINRMYEIQANGTVNPIGSVGFLYKLNASAGSSSNGVTMVGVSSSTLGDNKDETFDTIRGLTEANRTVKQVVICFDHGGTISENNRVGAIVIGGKGQELTTEVIVDVRAEASPSPEKGSNCAIG